MLWKLGPGGIAAELFPTRKRVTAQGLTYNITHSSVPSGSLSGVWVNGSLTDFISSTSFNFEVKNIDRIQVLIQDPVNDISDVVHSDAGLMLLIMKFIEERLISMFQEVTMIQRQAWASLQEP